MSANIPLPLEVKSQVLIHLDIAVKQYLGDTFELASIRQEEHICVAAIPLQWELFGTSSDLNPCYP